MATSKVWVERILYACNMSSEDQINAHLENCKDNFHPPLGSRVDISTYSLKLYKKAHRFEAWSSGLLVGLLAFYVEPTSERSIFITNLSVDFKLSRRGIGSQLIERCIAFARRECIAFLRLRVDLENTQASRLYHKHGFKKKNCLTHSESSVELVLDLRE